MKKLLSILFLLIVFDAQSQIKFSELGNATVVPYDSARIVGIEKIGGLWTNKLFFPYQFGKTRIDSLVAALAGKVSTGTLSNYVLAQRFLDSIAAAKPVYSTYTPTLTNTTNITSSSVQLTNNYRIGNISHFSASGNITPSATGVVELTFTLPVVSTNTTGYTIGFGDVGINAGTSYTSGEVVLVSSTTAKFRFITTSATTSSYQFSIDYNF